MKQITLEPFYPENDSVKAYLINESHAIHSDGKYVSLVSVVATDDPETYKAAANANFIIVDDSGQSALTYLERVVTKLQSMSAYTLLTEHHDQKNEIFLINKQKEQAP